MIPPQSVLLATYLDPDAPVADRLKAGDRLTTATWEAHIRSQLHVPWSLRTDWPIVCATLAILYGLLAAGCGSGPGGGLTAPTDAPLAGTYTGSLSLASTAPVQTAWTFHLTSPGTYTTSASGIPGAGSVTLTSAVLPSGQFSAFGTFFQGQCRADLRADGTATRSHITASLTAFQSCGPMLTGHLELAR